MVDIATLLQYLFSGDFLGFFQAIYVAACGSVDLFYGLIVMAFTIPIYIRARSFSLLMIVWVLLGGFMVAVSPILSPLAVFLLTVGLGSLLYKLWGSIHA